MALVVDLKITAGGTLQRLGSVEIVRQESLENPEFPYDEVHTYVVKRYKGFGGRNDGVPATVEHRYGDGAWALVQKALAALKIEDRMPQSDT